MAEMALIKVEKFNPVTAFVRGGLDETLAGIKKVVSAEVPDTSTKKGRDSIKSLHYQLARSKTFVEKQAKDLIATEKAKVQCRVDEITVERKKAWSFFEKLQEETRKPLTLFENAEKERTAKHKADIEIMRNLAEPNNPDGEPYNAGMLRAKLTEVEAFEMGEIWEEFAGAAAKTKDESIAALKTHIERREKYEAEQVELERLRKEAAERKKKERDERIAREAAEKAKAEAEKKAREEQEAAERKAAEAAAKLKAEKEAAERREQEVKEAAEREKQAAIEREEQAKRDRIAAEERAKIEKEMAVKAAEEKARQEAERREKERLEKEAAEKAEAERKAADLNHRREVNNAALACFEMNGIENGKEVITLIASGSIDYITINY